MKTTTGKQVHYDSGPNMTPLVDVVMVILIFLMLAGSFAGMARFIRSKATVQGAGPATVDPPHPRPLETPLNVAIVTKDVPAGGFWATWSTPRGPQRTDNPQILTEGLTHQREVFESTGTDPKSIQVVVKPDRGVKYQDLIRVYQAASAARIERIAFSTLK